MPSRRSLLLGTAGLIAGSGAIFGTGAFTSVEAERTVTVQTAGDNSAALALDTIENSPNSTGDEENSDNNGYVTLPDNGTLSIDIPNVNLEAVTHINRLFQVTNKGTQGVVVYIQEVIDQNEGNDSGNAIDFNAKTDQFEDSDATSGGSQGIADPELADISAPSGVPSDVGILLPVGESVEVGISVDTSDDNLNNGVNSDENAGVGSGEAEANELLLESARIIADSTLAESENNYNFKIPN